MTGRSPAGLGDAATIPNAVVVPSALGLFLLAEFAMLGFVVGVWVSQ